MLSPNKCGIADGIIWLRHKKYNKYIRLCDQVSPPTPAIYGTENLLKLSHNVPRSLIFSQLSVECFCPTAAHRIHRHPVNFTVLMTVSFYRVEGNTVNADRHRSAQGAS